MGGFHQLHVSQRVCFKRYNCMGLQDWFIHSGTIAAGSVSQALEGDIITVQFVHVKEDLMLLFKEE